jgi:uncharacterized membrane protein
LFYEELTIYYYPLKKMGNRQFYLHYLCLTGVIALSAILRFWNLDLKPLWLDEVITAIFSFGKSYNDLPLETLLPLERVPEIFTLQSGVSCSQIAKNLATQSTHPPLFFCWMYSCLNWLSPLGNEWITKLRFPAAFFGVGAVVAIYYVNRLAFSPLAGILAAAFMAVSPLGVYLSQEARHYTLPMLLITLALLGLVQIVKDIEKHQKVRFLVVITWSIVNSISLYVHYFCLLAFIAQIATLVMLLGWRRANIKNKRPIWLALIVSISVVAISFLPWLPVIIDDYSRAETEWLQSPTNISPLYQTLISWVLMVISLPVENQPLAIAIISGLSMLLFSIWVGWQVIQGLRQLLYTQSTHLATLTLLSFFVCVLLEFFIIAYFFDKDITAVPRYHFIYYPSFCAILAVGFAQRKQKEKNRKKSIVHFPSIFIVFLVAILSCVLIISNLVFQKPFAPEQVAQNMNQDPSVSLMLVVGYRDYQDVALGLSFALALEPLREVEEVRGKRMSPSPSSDVAFFKQSPDFVSVLQKLSELSPPTATQLNLWVVGPGRKRRDYPQQIALSPQMTCTINSLQHYRIGVPYQLYHCGKRF